MGAMRLLSTFLFLGFAAAQTTFHFDFTSATPTAYSNETGHGLEMGSDITKSPFYFSVRVPEEGNYKVTVKLGDRAAASVTTV